MNQIERAEAIQKVMEMRNTCDALLDILLPEGEVVPGCPHPAEAIEDCSTMDDEDQRYRCTKCGAESATPFPSIQPED